MNSALDLDALRCYVYMPSLARHMGERLMDSRLLSGTVDTLLLEVISDGETYGYAIAQTVLGRSRGYFEITEGSLYPALHRLERQKLVESFWKDADGRERKYYKLTPAGRTA